MSTAFHYLVTVTVAAPAMTCQNVLKMFLLLRTPDTVEPAHQRPAYTQAALNMYTVFWRCQSQCHINTLTA